MTGSPDRADGNKLPPGYKLQNYRIRSVLGEGGFGITYLAEDEMLHQKVAIKEYFPTTLASRDATTARISTTSADAGKYFKWGLDRFISEARIMARIDHPNIVRVFNFATSNGTGYMVMPYEQGEPLDKWLNRFRDNLPPPDVVHGLLEPITRALGVIHGLSLIHRDVKPANIFIRESGSPVLLDFGAARSTVGAASRTVAAIVSTGYSPIEQYSDVGEQGPWTDIYATAAVAYRLLTGNTPPDAPSRINAVAAGEPDNCKKLIDLRPEGFSEDFLRAIDYGLEVRPNDRPQDIAAWREALGFPPTDDVRAVAPVVNPSPAVKRASRRDGRVSEAFGSVTPLRMAAGVAALTALAGGTYLTAINLAAPKPETAAPQQTAQASTQSEPSTATSPAADPFRPAGSTAQAATKAAAASRSTDVAPDAGATQTARLQQPNEQAGAAQVPARSHDGKTVRERALEQVLSSSLLWNTLRMEFGDWYRPRLRQAANQQGLKANHSAVTKLFLPDLRELRLREARHVLLAPSNFKGLAGIYVWNLQTLKEHSDAACRDGIQQGENTQYLDVLLTHQTNPFDTLYGMILRGAALGKALPDDVGEPTQSDYRTLVKRLRVFGWKQRDIDLFADPERYAKVSAARACTLMMQYFQAQLAIDDSAVQTRLLKATLTNVIAQ
ncbi:MAG: protein kinase [Pseudomonadota bacterium]